MTNMSFIKKVLWDLAQGNLVTNQDVVELESRLKNSHNASDRDELEKLVGVLRDSMFVAYGHVANIQDLNYLEYVTGMGQDVCLTGSFDITTLSRYQVSQLCSTYWKIPKYNRGNMETGLLGDKDFWITVKSKIK